MMNSKKLEYTPRRHYRDRSPRERGDHDERWREAQACRSNASRDSHRTYHGEHPMGSGGTKEKRMYMDSPPRGYGKDPSSRDRTRRSPARRCVTPDRDEGGDGEYTRFRYPSPKTSTSQEHRLSERRKSLSSDFMDDFKYRRLDSDFRSWPPTKEDIDYGKRSEESKRRPTPEDFAYRHPSEYAMDRRMQDRNVARDTKLLPESSSMVYDATRDRNESTSHVNYNRWHPSPSFPGSETSRQAEPNSTNRSPALAKSVPEQTSRGNGFQRFLSVLNKGVDVDMLTKIVARTPSVPGPRNTGEPPGSHGGTGKQDEPPESVYWNKTNGPRENALSHEAPDINHVNTSTRLTPTQAVAQVKVTLEEEQKCKEMQHLFQTIGMDLGLEELGKMSNRIQQRLYGNREDRERKLSEKETRRETRPIFSPGCNSRSTSSSRSSFGPPVTQHNPPNMESLGAPANVSENDQAASAANQASIRNYDHDRMCQDSNAPLQSTFAPLQSTFAPNTTYNLPQTQAPTGLTPSYPSTPFSPHLYPPTAYNIPPPWGVARGMMPFPPYPPGYLPGHMPYPGVPAFPNYHPAHGQSNTVLQGAGKAQLGCFQVSNFPNPQQKFTSRPRYLQVIDTDRDNKT